MQYQPYCYLIGWTKQNIWYYGAEFKKTKRIANPNNLWVTYFTSSVAVKNFRKQNGDPDVIQIRKTFDDSKRCCEWEHKVLRRMLVRNNPKWLNQSDNKAFSLEKMSLGGTTSKNNKSGFHDPEERQKYALLGAAVVKGKSYVSNGEEEKILSKEEAEIFIKENPSWHPGRKKRKSPVFTKPRDMTKFKSKEFRDLKREQMKQHRENGVYNHIRYDNENNGMFGKKHSAETLEKQRQAKLGKYDGEKNPNFGRKHSPEIKMNLSFSRSGTVRVHRGETRKYIKKVLLNSYLREGWEIGFKS